MTVLFVALLLVGIFSAAWCHIQGTTAFSRMVDARTDADCDAHEAEWKHWRQLQFHISLGMVVLIGALAEILK